MATLLELHTIEANSQADPSTATGDVLAAVQLRQKVRTAVIKRASIVLGTALPTGDTRGVALELLAWAQRAVNSPDAAAGTALGEMTGEILIEKSLEFIGKSPSPDR